MHIYKWTQKETGKCYIGQSIQEPNQRRANGSDTFNKTRFTSGWEWSEEQKAKLSNRATQKGRTWKLVDGKRTWMETV